MIYNLDERATLYDKISGAGLGTLREMISMSLTWDKDRFDTALIETVTQAVYSSDMIAEIAAEANINAAVNGSSN